MQVAGVDVRALVPNMMDTQRAKAAAKVKKEIPRLPQRGAEQSVPQSDGSWKPVPPFDVDIDADEESQPEQMVNVNLRPEEAEMIQKMRQQEHAKRQALYKDDKK